MPFVTEYNTNLVFKKLIGEIPDNIREWQPYKKSIYFLNRLDKTNLQYFKKFCENPIENIDSIYKAIEVVDKKIFVYEGSLPSYHKYENCDRLSSNFVNYRIPTQIKEKGEEEIEKYRVWFKENESVFSERPDIYQMRLQTKFGIVENIQKVDYKNSGNVYKENLTLQEIEARIDSLLHNAAEFYKRNEKRQAVIRRFQTATFLAFKEDEIENKVNVVKDSLELIRKEPTFYKTYSGADNTYAWWNSIMNLRLENCLLDLNVPIYLAQVSSDIMAPPISAQNLNQSFIKKGKTNLLYKEYDGYDHAFFDKDGNSHLVAVITECINWILKKQTK